MSHASGHISWSVRCSRWWFIAALVAVMATGAGIRPMPTATAGSAGSDIDGVPGALDQPIETPAAPRVPANGTLRVKASVVGGRAIVGTVTVTASAGGGFATVYGCADGLPSPLTSNVNFEAGVDVANSFVVRADAEGYICVTPSVDAHVIVDQVAESSSLTPHAAIRRTDTRLGGASIPAGRPVAIEASSAGGVAIVGTVTITGAAADGFATVYGCADGLPVPLTSNVNFRAGRDVANTFVTRADGSGEICVVASVDAHVIVDQVAESAALSPHGAIRLLDTRPSGARAVANVPKAIRSSDVGGRAIVGTVTVTDSTADGFATVYGCADGPPVPLTSNVNFRAGIDVANTFVARADANGDICVAASADAHLIIDQVAESSALAPHAALRQVDTREGYVRVYDNQFDEGQTAFRIDTSVASYVYQKTGAGFSSLLDPLGNDWIDYHPGGGFAGEYRGVPNIGGCCHPGFPTATEGVPMTSTVVLSEPRRVVIRSVSADGTWDVSWDFRPTYATFTITAAAKPFWLLYEGTPGGLLGSEDYWVTSAGDRRDILTGWFGNDLAGPEWVYFADGPQQRSFFFAHHEDDAAVDEYWSTGLMTVFGFMRNGADPTISPTLPQHLSIGLISTTDHATVASQVAAAYSGA